MTKTYTEFSYDQHARKCQPDDFWRQTKRTINGNPVSSDQIQLIVKAIKTGLALNKNDVVLELACGNGALSKYLFESCKGYLGTDISKYLISVAKENFERAPQYQFHQVPALEQILKESKPEKYTKLLCYAGLQYFSDTDIRSILNIIGERFLNLDTIFLGSIPDMARYQNFYKDRVPTKAELKDSNTAVGIWRGEEELKSLVDSNTWEIEFFKMPEEFYASNYRFDVRLSKRG